ncbi:MAG: bifunctional ornithine acetyltransferase/N-acetylglutamate synthase [Gammaproteobacteria bacterium]|nr:MAG: bifunctional ornithine acetyltransferase/N-acetylglutamate synthase [Gammaproteobacteria bacterium]
MAVGEFVEATLHPVKGVKIGVAEAGIRYADRKDVVVFELCAGATSVGVFTQNRFCAAPVQLSKQHLARTQSRYWLVNTGNANAGTGQRGLDDALESCLQLAGLTGADVHSIQPFSTGVIGEFLPMDKLLPGIKQALSNLDENHWSRGAEGILTTDTRIKAASRQFKYQDQLITVTGIAKGAGMIMPNMATLLSFIATDAAVEQSVLQDILTIVANKTFNRTTIDGDTSTNDSCMLAATGRSKTERMISSESALYQPLFDAIYSVSLELAQGIIKDGEGATKFVTVEVTEGKDEASCLDVAYTVAHSPLVKTALFASDPNWGRILAAVGRAPVDHLEINRIKIYLDDVCIVSNGAVDPDYREELGQGVMDQDEITIRIVLGLGAASETVWTSDLSYDYVKINAEYRS